MVTIGKRNSLRIVRSAPPGFYLDGEALGEILLPGRYITPAMAVGGLADVFVYRDSEDRLVATTEQPFATVGKFAALKVVGIKAGVGAFLDWGLDKDLLLPIREMDGPLNPGDFVVVQVALDKRTDRLVASARINRHLDLTPPPYHEGQSVQLLVASKSPLGYNLIVNHAHRGLIYSTEVPGQLKIGQTVEGYVRAIRPDGKLDLALGHAGYRRIGQVTEIVLEKLKAAGGSLPYHDNSLPEEIREVFGVSKKAFKQAIGALFRDRLIYIDEDGLRLRGADSAAKN